MNSPRQSSSGLTLVELLVSIALTAILVTAAIAVFQQMRNLTHRIELRQQLHNSARTIFERLNWELSSLMQDPPISPSATRRSPSPTTPPTRPSPN